MIQVLLKGATKKRSIFRTFSFRKECLRKGGGRLEDVVFKKVISFVVYFKMIVL
jgi:hypothetical protein